jgi:plasmid stability protein
MKTTLDLPDELMRAIKVRAAQQDRKIKDVVTELLKRGLTQAEGGPTVTPAQRVTLPLVQCEHPARPDREMTPDRVAAALLDQEANWASGRDDAAV